MANQIPGCFCDGKLANSGTPNKQEIFGILTGKYVTPLVADDGTRNSLDLSASDLGQELLDKINHPDPSKRWYPYHKLKNVTEEQADANFDEADDGSKEFLSKGIKSKTMEMWSKGNQYFAKVPGNCTEFGEYDIDDCASIRGEKESLTDTKLYPREVNHRSVDNKFMNKTNDATQKIIITYDYDKQSSDENQYMVPASAFAPYNPLRLSGMLDVDLTLEALTNTTIQVDATLHYGTADKLIKVKGLVTADFEVINTDTGDTLTVTVAESTTVAGRYVITIDAGDAPTAGDVLTVKVFKAATGNNLKGKESKATEVIAV